MSTASDSAPTKPPIVQCAGCVHCARVAVVAVAKALVDAKSGEQRARAIELTFIAVERLRKAGG